MVYRESSRTAKATWRNAVSKKKKKKTKIKTQNKNKQTNKQTKILCWDVGGTEDTQSPTPH